MAKRPTEEDLGIETTPEEIEALARPAPEMIEDDVPITSDDETDPASHHIVVPKPEAAAKTLAVKDPVTGKFVATKATDAAPITEAPRPDNRTVDLRALQEERALRRQTEERMNTLLEVLNKREARAAKAEEPPPPAVPDKTLDPLGNIDHRFEDLASRLGRMEGESKAQAEARQAQERAMAEDNETLSMATPQFAEATKADPTLPALQASLLESFAREIAYVNRIPIDEASPQQRQFIERELHKLEMQHIRYALANNMELGGYMRGLAQSRGVTPAAATTAATAKTAPKSIADRQAAQQRHMSIGDLPGSAAPTQITAKDIGKMSTKQFAAFAKSIGEAGLDEIMAKAS